MKFRTVRMLQVAERGTLDHLQRVYGLSGIPICFVLRRSENPFATQKPSRE